MSSFVRAGARVSHSGAPTTHRAVIQRVQHRQTSWIAFEQPNPALYKAPESVNPKCPPTAVEPKDKDGAPPTTDTAAETASAASQENPGAHEALALTKTNPTPSPAKKEATMLSQIRKRSFKTSTQPLGSSSAAAAVATSEPVAEIKHEKLRSQRRQAEAEGVRDKENVRLLGSPTLRLCMPGHPATWPVDEPRYPMTRAQLEAWIAEGELISQGKLPPC